MLGESLACISHLAVSQGSPFKPRLRLFGCRPLTPDLSSFSDEISNVNHVGIHGAGSLTQLFRGV